MMVKTLEDCWRLADMRSDADDDDAAHAINFAASVAVRRQRWLKQLAWACLEKNARKRKAALLIVLNEISNTDESSAEMPMRQYCEG